MECVAYVHNRFPVIDKNEYFSYYEKNIIIKGQVIVYPLTTTLKS